MSTASPGGASRGTDPAAPGNGEEDLALALLNTQGLIRGSTADGLRAPDGLLEWLTATGLAADRAAGLRAAPPASAVLLTEARRLRAHVGVAVEALASGATIPSEAVFGIDRVLASSRASRRLLPTNDRPDLHEVECSPSLLALLAPVALAAAALLMTADPGRLRRCARHDCGAWFLDTSKAGRRKWCSMATCGNRSKAATHRRKRRAAGTA